MEETKSDGIDEGAMLLEGACDRVGFEEGWGDSEGADEFDGWREVISEGDLVLAEPFKNPFPFFEPFLDPFRFLSAFFDNRFPFFDPFLDPFPLVDGIEVGKVEEDGPDEGELLEEGMFEWAGSIVGWGDLDGAGEVDGLGDTVHGRISFLVDGNDSLGADERQSGLTP